MASVRSRDAVAAWGLYKKWRAHFLLPFPPGASTAYRPLPHRLPRVLGATPMGGREASH